MEEKFIEEKQSTITMNTTAITTSNYQEKVSVLNGKATIEIGTNKAFDKSGYFENKFVMEVEIDRSVLEEDVSFKLVCGTNEYFFAIQEYYWKLLNDNNINNLDLLNTISPRVELLEHVENGGFSEASIQKRNMKYLLNHSIVDRRKLKNFLEENHPLLRIDYALSKYSGHSIFERFYIVLNRFVFDLKKVNYKTRLIEYRNEKNMFKPLNEGKKKNTETEVAVALIVHGLASRIGKNYYDIANYLYSKGYKVYGFDYYTINESITDNGFQLSKIIHELKQLHPKSKILIVSHSMGGLVSRSANIEHSAKIDQLIMAGTPNSGSLLVSIPMLARLTFITCYFLKKKSIKKEDFIQLVKSKSLKGFKDLSNNDGYITQLNRADNLHHTKKYFALAGHYCGLSNDMIVSSENITNINSVNMPHISNNWNHLSYFNKQNFDYSVGKGIQYLK